MPACRSPSSAKRGGTVAIVKSPGSAVVDLVPADRRRDRRFRARRAPSRRCGSCDPGRSGCSRRTPSPDRGPCATTSGRRARPPGARPRGRTPVPPAAPPRIRALAGCARRCGCPCRQMSSAIRSHRARRAPRRRCGRRVARRRRSPPASGRDRCATRRDARRRSVASSTGAARPSTSARPRRHRRDAGHTAHQPCGSSGGSGRAPSAPTRGALGQALLVHLLAGDAGGEAVQHARSVAERPHDAVGDGEVVAGEIELGLAARREVHAVGIGQPHRAIADLEHDRRAGL